MTDQELLGIARQSLNMARTDRDLNGWPTGIVLAVYNVTDRPPLHRMRLIEDLMLAKLGKGWLDNGAAKDAGFGMLRLAMAAAFRHAPEAIAIATATNMFKPTAKYAALPRKEKIRIAKTARGHFQHHRMAAEGLFEIVDSITAVVQTGQRVCNCSQPVERGTFVGGPTVHYFAQSEFEGRLKMYGVEMDKEEIESVAKFRAAYYDERGKSNDEERTTTTTVAESDARARTDRDED